MGGDESRTWGGLRRSSSAELLEWHCVDQGDMPDDDTTVLMWVKDGDVCDWAGGWRDGDVWRDAASGGVVAGTVTHWAAPSGPRS